MTITVKLDDRILSENLFTPSARLWCMRCFVLWLLAAVSSYVLFSFAPFSSHAVTKCLQHFARRLNAPLTGAARRQNVDFMITCRADLQ